MELLGVEVDSQIILQLFSFGSVDTAKNQLITNTDINHSVTHIITQTSTLRLKLNGAGSVFEYVHYKF